MKIKEINQRVKEKLTKSRYNHSIRVARLAKELAKKHGESHKKIVKAALLHDVGYYFIKQNRYKGLHHAKASEKYAKKIGIENKKILEAIRFHTFGNVNMTKFSKILFLADKLEPYRDFNGIDIIRKISYYDIDLAMYFVLKGTKKYLNNKRERVHQDTVELYLNLEKKLF